MCPALPVELLKIRILKNLIFERKKINFLVPDYPYRQGESKKV